MTEIDQTVDVNKLSKITFDRLPSLTFRDWLNRIKQNIKFKYLPFRLYHRIRCYKYARYRSPELQLISSLVRSDQNSIDIGANLGLFTYFMSRASKHVFAFEPNPYPLENLKGLVDRNVTILPIALGSNDGPVKIRIPHHRKGWSSNGASLASKSEESGKLINIQCRKLDSLDIDNVGLIKIDVEGFEIEVLKGAKETILKNKPTMIIENEAVHVNDTNELFIIMNDLGYDKYICNPKGQLEKINNFSVVENQKFLSRLDINYIQNFIFIPKVK